MSTILTMLQHQDFPLEGYSSVAGLIRYKGRIYAGSSSNTRQILLKSFHASAFGGHSGRRTTYHRLKKLFYWPKLKEAVKKLVSECPICQINRFENIHIPGLLNPLEIPQVAWTHISMDFIEGLPKSKGKDVILVVVDRLTKYAHLLTLSHPYTMQQVVQIFMDNIFELHGMPIAIITDRDRIFTSKLFQEVFKALKVSLRFSTAYHP